MQDRRIAATLPLTLLALMLAPACLEPVAEEIDDATSDGSSGEPGSAGSTTDPDAWPPTLTTTEGTAATDTMDPDASVAGEPEEPECEVGAKEACPYSGPAGTAGVGACRPGMRVCGEDRRWAACDGEVLPAAEDCGTKADESCDGEVGCTGAVEWVRSFGEQVGDTPGQSIVYGATVDGAGDVWLTGGFGESVQFGDDAWDVGDHYTYFIAHVDRSGEAVFSFGDEQEGAVGSGAALAADGNGRVALSAMMQGRLKVAERAPIYETNQVTRAAIVAAIDEQGNYLWSRMMSTDYFGSTYIAKVAFAADGRVWAAGHFRSEKGFVETGAGTLVIESQGGYDGLLVRIEPDGDVTWARGFGDSGDQTIYGVAVDGAGDVWIAGEFTGSLQHDGGVLYAGGEPDKPDMFVVKLDAEGRWKWGRAYGGPGHQRFLRMQVDGDGNGIVTGEYDGASVSLGTTKLTNEEATTAKVLAKIDTNGKTLWAQSWPCSKYCYTTDMAVDGAGQIVVSTDVTEGTLSVAGQHFEVLPADETETVLVKLDRDGHPVWPARSLPAEVSAVVTRTGEIYLAGTYKGDVSFGPAAALQLEAGDTDTDIVVARLRP